MKPGDILREAAELVDSDRARDHGDFAESGAMIAAYWEIHLKAKGVAVLLDPWDVAMMMADVKRARASMNPKNLDNYRDGAGYNGLAAKEIIDV